MKIHILLYISFNRIIKTNKISGMINNPFYDPYCKIFTPILSKYHIPNRMINENIYYDLD